MAVLVGSSVLDGLIMMLATFSRRRTQCDVSTGISGCYPQRAVPRAVVQVKTECQVDMTKQCSAAGLRLSRNG